MKCRGNQQMRTLLIRALWCSAAAAMALNPALVPAVASDYRPIAPATMDGQLNARFLSLGIGKSIVIDLPRDIKDVLVADPKIANAVVRSAQRAYIIGAAIGQTNIVFFDSAGQQIAAYDIAVKRDLNGVRAALKQALPTSDIQVDGLGDGVILTGTAANPMDRAEVADKCRDLIVPVLGQATAGRLVETVLTLESVRQYIELGVLTESGGIEIARTEERMQELTRRMASARAWGIEPAELLTPQQVKELVPFINEELILGAFYTPSAAVVDSLRAATIMRERAQSARAELRVQSTIGAGTQIEVRWRPAESVDGTTAG